MLDFWKALPEDRRGRGPEVVRWIETHCVFTDGQWIGQKVKLLLWQKIFIYCLFATGEDGLRLFRWALLGIPKKNGKTELAAFIALYLLIGDGEPAPLVVCAAASDEQADLVFGAAKKSAEMSPTLSEICECYDKQILVPSIPGARLKRVAAVAGTNDGQNIHAVICDELHEWVGAKGENVWNVLTNGTGARRQPMVLQITTAGWDTETICYQQYDYASKVESGEVDDPRYLSCWIEAPDDADYSDPKVWEAANPSWGAVLTKDFYEDQFTKKKPNTFRRYFLNQWTESDDAWLPPGLWQSLAAKFEFNDSAMWIGVDASTKHDSTAAVCVQWQDGKLYAKARIWERPIGRDGKPLEGWKLPIPEIENHLRDLHRRYNVKAIGYDPALFERSAQQLETERLPMIEIPQSDARIVPSCQATYELAIQERIRHDGDRTFARHIASAASKEANHGGWRLVKVKAKAKMDAAMALVFAVGLAYEPTTAAPNVRVMTW